MSLLFRPNNLLRFPMLNRSIVASERVENFQRALHLTLGGIRAVFTSWILLRLLNLSKQEGARSLDHEVSLNS